MLSSFCTVARMFRLLKLLIDRMIVVVTINRIALFVVSYFVCSFCLAKSSCCC